MYLNNELRKAIADAQKYAFKLADEVTRRDFTSEYTENWYGMYHEEGYVGTIIDSTTTVIDDETRHLSAGSISLQEARSKNELRR